MVIVSINKYFWKKGGSEAVFFSEKEMLEDSGHHVIPFSMHSKFNQESPYAKYFVSEVDYNKGGLENRFSSASKIIYSFDARKKMKTLLDECKPDLSHFHIFQHQISPSVFGPLREKGVPIILTLHDLKPICPNYKDYVNGKVCEACKGRKFYNCFLKKCTKGSLLGSFINTIEMYFHYAMGYYQNVDRYIAVSRFYKQKMVEAGFPDEQIDYLPNFIDVHAYDPYAVDKGYILYFGRLSEEKGVSTFLNAAMLNRSIPHYIVGTGPEEEDLKKKAVVNNLKNVHFLGFKQGEDLKKLLSKSTCVVIPSEWYENSPMSVLEAFAAGRPVIGSDIGGIPELIENNVDGFIFKPGDAEALSEHIKWMWDNRSMAREMGLQGRKKVEQKFSAELHYQGLMSIYNSVLNAAR